jgi:hypothetical protein
VFGKLIAVGSGVQYPVISNDFALHSIGARRLALSLLPQ